MRQVTIWLPGESIEKLDRLADKRETHRAEIIEGMIRRARE
jgi:predicted transcriptional regulator